MFKECWENTTECCRNMYNNLLQYKGWNYIVLLLEIWIMWIVLICMLCIALPSVSKLAFFTFQILNSFLIHIQWNLPITNARDWFFSPCYRQVPFKLKILMTECFPLKVSIQTRFHLRQISLFMHVWRISFYSLYDHTDDKSVDAASQSLFFSASYTFLFLSYMKLPKFPPCLIISQWYCIFIVCANRCTERSLCHCSLWYNNCKLRNVCCLTY